MIYFEIDEFIQYIRCEHQTFLENNFTGYIPTLEEIVDKTIEYCNAADQPNDNHVYLLTFPSGKQYAGQTVSYVNRMSKYKNNIGSNDHLSNALAKYGFDNIDVKHKEIPAICTDLIEIFMIQKYDLTNRNNGYNKQSGGKNGYEMTDEIKSKLRASMIGKSRTEESKIRQSISMLGVKNHNYGKPKSDYVKAKLSAANSGENNYNWGGNISTEHKTKISISMLGVKNPQFGKPLTDEHKIKIKTANTGEKNHNFGKHLSYDVKLKISAAKTGIPLNQEHRNKISVVQTGEKNHREKPVVVEGRIYSYAKEASRIEFPNFNEKYISTFIRTHPESKDIFYISNEFYNHVKTNMISNITRKMNADFACNYMKLSALNNCVSL